MMKNADETTKQHQGLPFGSASSPESFMCYIAWLLRYWQLKVSMVIWAERLCQMGHEAHLVILSEKITRLRGKKNSEESILTYGGSGRNHIQRSYIKVNPKQLRSQLQSCRAKQCRHPHSDSIVCFISYLHPQELYIIIWCSQDHHQFIHADALKLFFHTWPKYMSVAMNDSGLTCGKALSSQTNCTTKPLFLEIIGTCLIKPPTAMNYSCCSSFVLLLWRTNVLLIWL